MLRTERIESGATLVLPEICRIAAATDGALPSDVEVLWRVSPSTRRPATPFERCLDGGPISRPFWVTAGSAADARLLARSLPRGSTWAAHLRRRALPAADEVAMLREAGCGGLALAWSDQLEGVLLHSSPAEGAGDGDQQHWAAALQA